MTYTPTLKALKYTGKLPRVIREVMYLHGEKVVTLHDGDIVFVPTHVALLMKQRNQGNFEILPDNEAAGLFATPQPFDISTLSDEDLENEMIYRGLMSFDPAPIDDETVMPADAHTAEAKAEVVVTRENIMSIDIKDIKAACKTHNITIGKKKQDVLISLLLPFLD